MHSCTASIVNEMSTMFGSSFRGDNCRLCFFRFTKFLTVVVWCKFVCFGTEELTDGPGSEGCEGACPDAVGCWRGTN